MDMRRTVVLSASTALAVLLFCVAALLWTQQEAQAQEEPCSQAFCIDKSATPSTVRVGEQITFTITERCAVGGSCEGLAPLVDTLPSGLTGVTVEGSDPSVECSLSGNTVTCGHRFFSGAQPFTLTIVATTTECGTFTNTAGNTVFTESVTYTVNCLPTTKAQCKKGGFRDFGYPDQGTCITAFNENRP
jgi:hypothetical protein